MVWDILYNSQFHYKYYYPDLNPGIYFSWTATKHFLRQQDFLPYSFCVQRHKELKDRLKDWTNTVQGEMLNTNFMEWIWAWTWYVQLDKGLEVALLPTTPQAGLRYSSILLERGFGFSPFKS